MCNRVWILSLLLSKGNSSGVCLTQWSCQTFGGPKIGRECVHYIYYAGWNQPCLEDLQRYTGIKYQNMKNKASILVCKVPNDGIFAGADIPALNLSVGGLKDSASR